MYVLYATMCPESRRGCAGGAGGPGGSALCTGKCKECATLAEGDKWCAMCTICAEDHAVYAVLYAALYSGGYDGELCLLDAPEVMRCALLRMLQAVDGRLCLLEVLEALDVSEVLEVPEVIRYMLLCVMEAVDGGLCLRRLQRSCSASGFRNVHCDRFLVTIRCLCHGQSLRCMRKANERQKKENCWKRESVQRWPM